MTYKELEKIYSQSNLAIGDRVLIVLKNQTEFKADLISAPIRSTKDEFGNLLFQSHIVARKLSEEKGTILLSRDIAHIKSSFKYFVSLRNKGDEKIPLLELKQLKPINNIKILEPNKANVLGQEVKTFFQLNNVKVVESKKADGLGKEVNTFFQIIVIIGGFALLILFASWFDSLPFLIRAACFILIPVIVLYISGSFKNQ